MNKEGVMSMTPKWDVVIVGGGLAGYVAANFIVKTNLKVLILEKANKVGGRILLGVPIPLALPGNLNSQKMWRGISRAMQTWRIRREFPCRIKRFCSYMDVYLVC
jgi:NADPH-dependent 2,4-dienoyl-CoA reductase/sulfur reductase-like enzyme